MSKAVEDNGIDWLVIEHISACYIWLCPKHRVIFERALNNAKEGEK